MVGSMSIALVRANGFGALPGLLEERAGERAVLEVFEKEGLPIALRDALDTPMPLAAMMGLFSRAARLLGDRTFGLDVGERMGFTGYGLWTEYSTLAPTLGGALARLVATSWAHQSGSRLELVAERHGSVLRFVTPRWDGGKMQHSDHLIPPMVAFVRRYLGRHWQPDWIDLSYARDSDSDRVGDRLQVPMVFGRRGTGIGLRPADLALRAAIPESGAQRIVTLRDIQADVAMRDASEPARALSAIVTLRLLDGRSDIEGAARLAGLSVQGLQRRLRQKGYTYREILEAARSARAASLLRETELPVLQIALSLGYEDHSSFTRAFSRWAGCTPSQFRGGTT